MSAPAQKTNGLPVSTHRDPVAGLELAERRGGRTRTRCGRATVGFVQSSPLSIVTSASGPASVSTRFRKKIVSGTAVLPDAARRPCPCRRRARSGRSGRRAPHAVRELGHQPDAGGGQRMAAGDRAAVGVQSLVLGSRRPSRRTSSAPARRRARSARRGRCRRATGRCARARAFVAGTGPIPISSGSTPA